MVTEARIHTFVSNMADSFDLSCKAINVHVHGKIFRGKGSSIRETSF